MTATLNLSRMQGRHAFDKSTPHMLVPFLCCCLQGHAVHCLRIHPPNDLHERDLRLPLYSHPHQVVYRLLRRPLQRAHPHVPRHGRRAARQPAVCGAEGRAAAAACPRLHLRPRHALPEALDPEEALGGGAEGQACLRRRRSGALLIGARAARWQRRRQRGRPR